MQGGVNSADTDSQAQPASQSGIPVSAPVTGASGKSSKQSMPEAPGRQDAIPTKRWSALSDEIPVYVWLVQVCPLQINCFKGGIGFRGSWLQFTVTAYAIFRIVMFFGSYRYFLLPPVAKRPKLFARFPCVVCGSFRLLGGLCLVRLGRCFFLRSGFRYVFDIQV